MYVTNPCVSAVMSFIIGYNIGKNESPLMGMREYIIPKIDGGNNMSLTPLIMEMVMKSGWNHREVYTKDDQGIYDRMHDVFSAFFDHRMENGLESIFYYYGKWLLEQEWYEGSIENGKM